MTVYIRVVSAMSVGLHKFSGCYFIYFPLGMMVDQTASEVKTAPDNGVTDLQLPEIKRDTVDAAWGTIWEKDWEAVENTAPSNMWMGSPLRHTSTRYMM